MRIIISPAKRMNVDTDTLPYRDLPAFLFKTQQLLDRLRDQSGLQGIQRLHFEVSAQG